jgi:hypothetical protein
MTEYLWRFKCDDGKWTTLHWTMTEEAAHEWARGQGCEIERLAERRTESRLPPVLRRSGYNLAEMGQQKHDRRHIQRDRRRTSPAAAESALERRQRERRTPLEYPGF